MELDTVTEAAQVFIARLNKILLEDKLTKEEWTELYNINVRINAKLTVLTKYKKEISEQFDLLNKKLNEFDEKYS